MTATTIDNPLSQAFRFYDAPIGKKVVMAATGVILFGFVLGHMAGNLQFFLGREKFDAYAELLRHTPALLWGVRGVLLISVILHITASIQLTALKQKARPIGYQKKAAVDSSYASRTMMWSGPILAAFIVYHLLHLTLGAGGLPFEILATTFSKILEPQFVNLVFKFNGAASSVKMGEAAAAALGPIRNPVTQEPETVRVDHATGFIFQKAECLSADEMRVSVGELKFSWPKKAAFLSQVKYGN